MSRIDAKRLLLLGLTAALLCASVCASAQQDILSADQLTPEEVNYRTETVELGTMEKRTLFSAYEYYPLTYSIRFEHDDAKFIEYTVARGDEVKAGDVLARFEIVGSEVALTRMELNLTRTEEETQRGIREREEEIARMRAEVAAEKDSYEKEKKELSLRKLEVELEQYRYRQQYSIDQQRAAVEEEQAYRAADVLISPVDGVVEELTYKKADDAVSSSETLLVISSPEVMLLRVDNSSGGLRYNMPVDVTSGNNAQRVELTGWVVAADDAIPEEGRTGEAYILLDPYGEDVRLRTLKVSGATILLENVPIAARSTATLENGKYYVSKLVDGMVQKRYVKVGLNSTTDIWFLQGVSEGDVLIVD